MENGSINFMNNNITILIKTFNRPSCLNRLLISIEKYYPDIKIIILNDGDNDLQSTIKNVTIINTEFDIGVSAGRNRLVSEVKTKYFITLDDDFIFTEDTKIENFYNIMENSNLTILAGRVNNKQISSDIVVTEEPDGDIVKFNLKKEFKIKYVKNLSYYHADFVYQFFIAKTKTIKDYKILWDSDIKIGEHSIYFYNIFKNHKDIVVGHTDTVNVLNNKDRTLSSQEYLTFRRRAKSELESNLHKYNVKQLVACGNLVYTSKMGGCND